MHTNSYLQLCIVVFFSFFVFCFMLETQSSRGYILRRPFCHSCLFFFPLSLWRKSLRVCVRVCVYVSKSETELGRMRRGGLLPSPSHRAECSARSFPGVSGRQAPRPPPGAEKSVQASPGEPGAAWSSHVVPESRKISCVRFIPPGSGAGSGGGELRQTPPQTPAPPGGESRVNNQASGAHPNRSHARNLG